MKLDLWKVVKATGGVTFVERKSVHFAFMFEDEAKALAALLNQKDRKIAQLIVQIDDMRRGNT